jgi:hypothetical protein
MSIPSPLGHEALLTLARKLEGAASDGDRDRAEAEARRLSAALRDHLRAEQPSMTRLPPETAHRLAEGQRRLLDDLLELAVDVKEEELWRCDRLARRLIAELTVQADDERRSGLVVAVP